MEGTILKLEHSNAFQPSLEGCKIHKIISSISPRTFIKLLKEADNKVNPRSAKINRITNNIHETLRTSPELYWFKTKGILISTQKCEPLERNRIRIKLNDTNYEGIMDGGHNTFAVATFIIEELFGIKLKTWDECKTFWDENFDEILVEFNREENNFPFTIPVEIIAPNGEQGSLEDYYDYIAEICAARNNNVQLTETAKGNQLGSYDALKQYLDGYDIVWKPGDDGKIKSDDVISLASLGLIFLDKNNLLPDNFNKSLNRVSIYSQKGKCVEFFNALMTDTTSVSDYKDGKYILKSATISSALGLADDILRYFDKLYLNFPNLYNRVSPRFGGIGSVKDIRTKVPFGTTRECSDYQYAYGFFYPLLYGLIELMRYDPATGEVSWIINPLEINMKDLDLNQYVDLIRMVNYDPQKIGKGNVFYNEAENVYRKYRDRFTKI